MKIAIIGGSGLDSIENLTISHQENVDTVYGETSAAVTVGSINGNDVLFLPRHGSQHNIPPHKINYRANIAALKQLGVSHIISVAAVGGITALMSPLKLVFPDQLIDYTYGREHTFSDGMHSNLMHVDFSYPYDAFLHTMLVKTANDLNLPYEQHATYGTTQGPRLETAAEIARMERDGCDIVGMTGMPEAALARELDIAYIHCAFVVNWAAGKDGGATISMQEIDQNLSSGSESVRLLLASLLPALLRSSQ